LVRGYQGVCHTPVGLHAARSGANPTPRDLFSRFTPLDPPCLAWRLALFSS